MTHAPFGPTGVSVPKVGLGTWQMENDERASAVRALRTGLDLGMTHVDTAELYGSGDAEEIVADAIAGRRDEVFLVSKVLPTNASRRGTIKACEASLERLRTDRLDCYLLHWSGSHPLADTIAAFEELVQKGKIRSYGVSNFDETKLAEALTIAGPGRLACNQCSIISASAPSSTRSCPGAKRTASPSSATRRSAGRASRRPRAERRSQRSPRSGRHHTAARARLPHAAAEPVRHPQIVRFQARARKRRGPRAHPHARGNHGD